MTYKEKYHLLCEKEPSIPIFMRDWWYDSVCKNSWDVILVEENNKIIAALPYYLHKKYCFKTIIPPHLTPIAGTWLSYQDVVNKASEYTFEAKVNNIFIEELKKLKIDWFYQHFHHSITNWITFYWAGFKQTTRYTYRILNLQDINQVYDNFHPKTKKAIRLAEKELTIDEDISLEEFYKVNSLTFSRQAVEVPYSKDLFITLASKCKEKNKCKLYAARDSKGNIHAVLMIVYDEKACYSLVSGADPKHRSSGATTLLNWHAIKYASSMGYNEFDFTGSMIEPIEKFMRHFGAVQTPYFAIEKRYSKLYSMIRALIKR